MPYHSRTTFSLRFLDPSCVLLPLVGTFSEPFAKVRFRYRYRWNGDFILFFIFATEEIFVQLLIEISHFDISRYWNCKQWKLSIVREKSFLSTISICLISKLFYRLLRLTLSIVRSSIDYTSVKELNERDIKIDCTQIGFEYKIEYK